MLLLLLETALLVLVDRCTLAMSDRRRIAVFMPPIVNLMGMKAWSILLCCLAINVENGDR